MYFMTWICNQAELCHHLTTFPLGSQEDNSPLSLFLIKGGSFILFTGLRIYKQERFAVKHQWGNTGGLRIALGQALLSQATPRSDNIYQPSPKSSWKWLRKPWERQMGMNIPRYSHLTLKAGLCIHKTENEAKCKEIQGSPELHLSFHLLQGT